MTLYSQIIVKINLLCRHCKILWTHQDKTDEVTVILELKILTLTPTAHMIWAENEVQTSVLLAHE